MAEKLKKDLGVVIICMLIIVVWLGILKLFIDAIGEKKVELKVENTGTLQTTGIILPVVKELNKVELYQKEMDLKKSKQKLLDGLNYIETAMYIKGTLTGVNLEEFKVIDKEIVETINLRNKIQYEAINYDKVVFQQTNM